MYLYITYIFIYTYIHNVIYIYINMSIYIFIYAVCRGSTDNSHFRVSARVGYVGLAGFANPGSREPPEPNVRTK